MRRRKLHWEFEADRVLFGWMPAYCGRTLPNHVDAFTFFASKERDVTCVACKKALAKRRQEHGVFA